VDGCSNFDSFRCFFTAFTVFSLGILDCSEQQPAARNSAVAEAAAPTAAPAPTEDAAPAAPSTPQQVFAMDPFDIPAGSEAYKCQDLPNPIDHDVAIIKTESTVTLGSHHMFAFRIPASSASLAPEGTKGDIVDCPAGGLEFHPYFHLTQRAHDITTYPPGVGRVLNASDIIRMNIHFLNPTGSPITASGQVTVSNVDQSAVSQLAAEIFIYSNSLHVPVGTSTQTFSYPFATDINFLQVTGHMHSRGTYLEAAVVAAGDAGKTSDAGDAGEGGYVETAEDSEDAGARKLYSTSTWNEPVSLDLAPPFEVHAGDSIRYSCTFDNETGGTLIYGQSAATNEMCNIFGVYYPSADGGGGTLAGL
jgi:hypothetical protein